MIYSNLTIWFVDMYADDQLLVSEEGTTYILPAITYIFYTANILYM